MSCITTLIRNNLKTSFYINFIAEAVAIIVFLTVVNSLNCFPNSLFEALQVYRWGSIFIGYFAQAYFAYYSVVTVSAPSVTSFIIVSCMTTFTILTRMMECLRYTEGQAMCSNPHAVRICIVLTGTIVLVNQIFYLIASRITKTDAEFVTLYRVGTDAVNLDKFDKYLEYASSSKLLLLTNILIFMAFFIFGDAKEPQKLIVDIIALVLCFVAVYAAKIAIVREKSAQFIVFSTILCLLQVYQLVRSFLLLDSSVEELKKTSFLVLFANFGLQIFSVLAYLYTNWLAYQLFNSEKGEPLAEIIQKQESKSKGNYNDDEVLDRSRNNSTLSNSLL